MLSNVETGYKTQFGPDARDIRGMITLVVGGTSEIGHVTATLLAENGAYIFYAAKNTADLESALASIRQAGGKAEGMVIDLGQKEAIQRCFDEAARVYGPVQALINTLASGQEPMLKTPDRVEMRLEEMQNAFTQEALVRLQGTTLAHIINIGQVKHSPTAHRQAAGLRQQARELGIRVTMIEPGNTRINWADEVARCVLGSLVQPFGVDAIFLNNAESSPVL